MWTKKATEIDESFHIDNSNKICIERLELINKKENLIATLNGYQIIGKEYCEICLSLVSTELNSEIICVQQDSLNNKNLLKEFAKFKIDENFEFNFNAEKLYCDLNDNSKVITFYVYPIYRDAFYEFLAKIEKACFDSITKNSEQLLFYENNKNENKLLPIIDYLKSNTTCQLNCADQIDFNYDEIHDKFPSTKRIEKKLEGRKLRIYCATWNVNGELSKNVSLKPWLSNSEIAPDIYAIGLQEVVLSKNYIVNNGNKLELFWIGKLKHNLFGNVSYVKLMSIRLHGMLLVIFIRDELKKYISNVSIQKVETGFINYLGNKGSVAISFCFDKTKLCFINSHLAAHTNGLIRRNSDCERIMRNCLFPQSNQKSITIYDHDQIFWMGDLNYRLTGHPNIALKENDQNLQLLFDQLKQEMTDQIIFNGFNEGNIKFQPTYKYDKGTDNWDTSPKKRLPAWCDRILWKGDGIKQLNYNSVMEIRSSDHKPVYGVFASLIQEITD